MTTRSDLHTPPTACPLPSRPAWSHFVPTARAASNVPFASASTAAASGWAAHVAAASSTWNRLTEAELLQSNGHIKTLAALIRERYWLSRAEADQQVRRFLREQTA